jgi:hypothetical protein
LIGRTLFHGKRGPDGRPSGVWGIPGCGSGGPGLAAAVASNSPAGHHAGFQRQNLTDDQTASGETSTHLPATDALLRAGIQLQTVNAVVRNLRLQRIYIESDR